jgi:7-carboxy-7-deazaguanine synthase
MFDIVEKFITLSGEAPMIGSPVFLIRFSNCNLNCAYCDTGYHTEVNEVLSIDALKSEISGTIASYPALKILFTGGEPLLNGRQDALLNIIESFPDTEFYIETNGSVLITDLSHHNSHYVMDWKTPSSGNPDCFNRDNLKDIRITHDCIKFVLNHADLEWVKEKICFIQRIIPKLPMYLSPQWGDIGLKDLAEFILSNKLPASLSLQLHKMIWGKDARGV